MALLKETLRTAFAGRRVLVTGHTGFKGAWLSEWLLSLGAQVTGLSLPPPTEPSLFAQLGLASRLRHEVIDIRDAGAVARLVAEVEPEYTFHLAAQSLVRLSYEKPVETYAVNVLGTVHVLEALRALRNPSVAVMITTDKCYENREWVHGYREEDPLGGHDPYSSSKAAAEIAIAAYRASFCEGMDRRLSVASARAGNVIGGGDWALDRIVPDSMRALAKGEPVRVRNPRSTRPWQHVLEPLGGYLELAARLDAARHLDETGQARAAVLRSGFNFGPPLASNRPVADLVGEILKAWPGEWVDESQPSALHEAKLLNLATDKAYHLLGWQPRWDFADTVRRTVAWYRASRDEGAAFDAAAFTRSQIDSYTSILP